MGRLKGGGVANSIHVYRQTLGEAELVALAADLPNETRALVARPPLAVEWVAVDALMPLHQAVLSRHLSDDELAFRRLSRQVCERDFTTFHKVLLRLASPTTILDRTSKVWSLYNDSGDLRILERREGGGRTEVVMRLDRFATRYAVFGLVLHAYMEQILAMARALDVDVRRTHNAVGTGGLDSEYLVSFRS